MKEIKKPQFESDTEKVTLNIKFTSQALRVNLIPVNNARKTPTEQAEENKSLNDSIEKERSAVIDSKIVAIMKTKKNCKHNELITKVMEMITLFKAQPDKIKARINELIKLEYMKRDENDRGIYIYLP